MTSADMQSGERMRAADRDGGPLDAGRRWKALIVADEPHSLNVPKRRCKHVKPSPPTHVQGQTVGTLASRSIARCENCSLCLSLCICHSTLSAALCGYKGLSETACI